MADREEIWFPDDESEETFAFETAGDSTPQSGSDGLIAVVQWRNRKRTKLVDVTLYPFQPGPSGPVTGVLHE